MDEGERANRKLTEAAMNLTESTVEDAALKWFGGLGYAIGHGGASAELPRAKPEIVLDEAAAERDSFGILQATGRKLSLNAAVPNILNQSP